MLYAALVALAACRLGWLTIGGGVAAAVVGGVIWEAGEIGMAAPLLAFFFSSSLLGRLPGGGKSGARTFGQVMANGGVAAIAAALTWFDLSRASTMFLAALCAANADTWATELGTRFGRKPIRITTLKPVEIGASGAVSVIGVLAALAGAAFVACVGFWIVGANLMVAAAAGFVGAMIDSVLGDTVQAKFWTRDGIRETGGTLIKGVRWIRNNEVNFAMTALAAALAYLLAG